MGKNLCGLGRGRSGHEGFNTAFFPLAFKLAYLFKYKKVSKGKRKGGGNLFSTLSVIGKKKLHRVTCVRGGALDSTTQISFFLEVFFKEKKEKILFFSLTDPLTLALPVPWPMKAFQKHP